MLFLFALLALHAAALYLILLLAIGLSLTGDVFLFFVLHLVLFLSALHDSLLMLLAMALLLFVLPAGAAIYLLGCPLQRQGNGLLALALLVALLSPFAFLAVLLELLAFYLISKLMLFLFFLLGGAALHLDHAEHAGRCRWKALLPFGILLSGGQAAAVLFLPVFGIVSHLVPLAALPIAGRLNLITGRLQKAPLILFLLVAAAIRSREGGRCRATA